MGADMIPPTGVRIDHPSLWVTVWFYALRHQELFAVLLGYFFGAGSGYLVHYFADTSKRRWMRPSLLALATFGWTAGLWALLDRDGDIATPLAWVMIAGAAICAPFVDTIGAALLKSRLVSRLAGRNP